MTRRNISGFYEYIIIEILYGIREKKEVYHAQVCSQNFSAYRYLILLF
jgi:hypothetical protein